MMAQWQHNPEGVPTAIQQEDDGSLNTSVVDILMWLRAITPTKGVMVRQHILQLFSKAGQWTSLINANCHDLLILVDDYLTLSPCSPSLHLLVLQARYFAICINLLAWSLSALAISLFISPPPHCYYLLQESL